MESVGSQLRQARVQQGLSREELYGRTRISLKILSALENDDIAQIGCAFFYRSYVRQVAAQLKLDYGLLEPAVREATSAIPEPRIPGQVPEGQMPPVAPRVDPLRERRPRNLSWLYSLVSFAVMLVACSSFYGAWQQSRFTWRAQLSALLSVLEPAQGAKGEPVQQSMAAFPAPPATDAAAGFKVELSAREPTWLSIVADGKQTFSGILQTAETKVLEGREKARIFTENAGALTFVFNGKPIGPFGSQGDIRTVVFTRDKYEVLQPAAHIALTRFTPTVE